MLYREKTWFLYQSPPLSSNSSCLREEDFKNLNTSPRHCILTSCLSCPSATPTHLFQYLHPNHLFKVDQFNNPLLLMTTHSTALHQYLTLIPMVYSPNNPPALLYYSLNLEPYIPSNLPLINKIFYFIKLNIIELLYELSILIK